MAALAVGGCHVLTSPGAGADPYEEFVKEVAARQNLDPAALRGLLGEARVQDGILTTIARPAEGMPWHRYRAIFVTEKRISEGIEFWRQERSLLDRAAAQYGVPPEIIVAILGVETRYGRHQGRHRVLDALVTLGFHYPPRSEFFRSELEQYILLTREEGLDPTEVRGSYAGAMGKAQFISSSYRHYAVDFDGDGRRDLINSTADAIGSVANYFRSHGWRPGGPVATEATAPKVYDHLLQSGLRPEKTLGQLRESGVRTRQPELPDDAEALLLALDQENQVELWVTLHNFYVITRYNHSALYAMAVYQLSQAIRAGLE